MWGAISFKGRIIAFSQALPAEEFGELLVRHFARPADRPVRC